MKSQLLVVAVCLLVVMPSIAIAAQTRRATQAIATAEPPRSPQHAFTNAGQHDEVIACLFAFQPAIPLGPVDVAQGIRRRNDFDHSETIRRFDQHFASEPSQSDYARRGGIFDPREISGRDDAA